MAGSIASYNRLDQLPEPKLPVKYPRTPGYRPGPEENRFNAWQFIRSSTRDKMKERKHRMRLTAPEAGVEPEDCGNRASFARQPATNVSK